MGRYIAAEGSRLGAGAIAGSLDITTGSLEVTTGSALEVTAGSALELVRADETASEASETIEETADDASESTELTADSMGVASEEEGSTDALELELGATLELDAGGSTGVTGVGVGRLKIQMSPMMTSAATMMIIQVLRFISY